jgi:hypothetical protein
MASHCICRGSYGRSSPYSDLAINILAVLCVEVPGIIKLDIPQSQVRTPDLAVLVVYFVRLGVNGGVREVERERLLKL